MTNPHFHWYLPTRDDSRYIVARDHAYRHPTINYLIDVARAAEYNGFESILTPTGPNFEESWLITAAISQRTETLKFLVAFRPGSVLPTVAAQMAATFQRMSGDRLCLNVVTGDNPEEQRAYGDFIDPEARYERTGEFLEVLKGCFDGRPYSFKGRYYEVEDGGLPAPPFKAPPVYFSGASEAAEKVAARFADIHLTSGESPPLAAQRVARMKRPARRQGVEPPAFGIRIHVINRDTSEEARAEAARLLDARSDGFVAERHAQADRGESARVAYERAPQNGIEPDRAALQVYPNIWTGIGSELEGAGTALVGSHAEVAQRIEDYLDAGIEHFILSGYPKLESAYWFGEGVMPLFRRRDTTAPPRVLAGRRASVI